MANRNRWSYSLMAVLAGFALPVLTADAGTEDVAYPKGFETEFLRYATKDKADRKITRFFYINRDAYETAKADAPLPYGTVLVMEDHKARLGAGDAPVLDADGALLPTDAVAGVFVMEKRQGWGAQYPEATRNGEWEYAWFAADGARRTDKTMDRCFECHKPQASSDYTFITMDALKRLKAK
ncbi:hypothetical protein BAL199_12181 [alpha proteobacterium BAL199]|jgi:hypothetical protein|nr:hypothetical protein BAL199_12181 [alpha proteobacterium BAL199]